MLTITTYLLQNAALNRSNQVIPYRSSTSGTTSNYRWQPHTISMNYQSFLAVPYNPLWCSKLQAVACWMADESADLGTGRTRHRFPPHQYGDLGDQHKSMPSSQLRIVAANVAIIMLKQPTQPPNRIESNGIIEVKPTKLSSTSMNNRATL